MVEGKEKEEGKERGEGGGGHDKNGVAGAMEEGAMVGEGGRHSVLGTPTRKVRLLKVG